jgi:hypothetical protein
MDTKTTDPELVASTDPDPADVQLLGKKHYFRCSFSAGNTGRDLSY